MAVSATAKKAGKGQNATFPSRTAEWQTARDTGNASAVLATASPAGRANPARRRTVRTHPARTTVPACRGSATARLGGRGFTARLSTSRCINVCRVARIMVLTIWKLGSVFVIGIGLELIVLKVCAYYFVIVGLNCVKMVNFPLQLKKNYSCQIRISIATFSASVAT